MNLSETAVKKLQNWIGRPDWDSGHPMEMQCWYDFVNQCHVDKENVDYRGTLNEDELKKIIEQKLDRPVDRRERGIIKKHFNIAMEILDFLEYTRR